MSDAQEVRLGAEAHLEFLKTTPALDHAALLAYVDDVGQRVARASARPELAWHFTVIDSAAVNAFSLPGGYVYLSRGLLAYLNSEAELAGVIAHEIGHVTARHGVARHLAASDKASVAQTLARPLSQGYGRERELEAARLGAECLAKAGYVPQAMLGSMETLAQHAADADGRARDAATLPVYHAALAIRAGRDERFVRAVEEATRHAVALPREGRNDYLQQIAGLVYGERPDRVVLRDNLLLHDGFGLAVQFPTGWKVVQQADRFAATSPADDARVELRPGLKYETSQEALQHGLEFDAGARFTSGTLSGYPAAFAAGADRGQPAVAAAIALNGGQTLIVGVARDAAAYTRERNTLRGAINSFRALTPAEREALRPRSIRLVSAKPGMSFAGLAQQSPLGTDAVQQLRLLNGRHPAGEPQPGELVKIVQ